MNLLSVMRKANIMDEVFKQLGSETGATMWIVSASLVAVFLDALGKTSEVKNSNFSQETLERIEVYGKLIMGTVALTFLARILVPHVWLLFPLGALAVFIFLALLMRWSLNRP